MRMSDKVRRTQMTLKAGNRQTNDEPTVEFGPVRSNENSLHTWHGYHGPRTLENSAVACRPHTNRADVFSS